jgi:O-methyltransferase
MPYGNNPKLCTGDSRGPLLRCLVTMLLNLLRKFFKTPKHQRLPKIFNFISSYVAPHLFPIINRPEHYFYLSCRPDFDIISHNFNNSQELHRIWIAGVEQNNYGDLARLYFLYANLSRCISCNIPGDFAEVGVYKGNSAKIMHLLDPNRTIYLFDTFEGFPGHDVSIDPTNLDKDSFKDTSIDYVRNFIGSNDKVIYCKGYFPDTTLYVPIETTFAFVHLDPDLYQPTKAGCEFFYPRLSKGGVMIIHDYYSGNWPGVTKAVDDFFWDKPESPVLIPDKSGSIAIIKNKY